MLNTILSYKKTAKINLIYLLFTLISGSENSNLDHDFELISLCHDN